MDTFLFLIILISNPIILSFSFINPYTISLMEEKILVIHKFGISICDSNTYTIPNNTILFSESEQITTDANLSKITHSSENGYIFCIINDKVYIFNEDGKFISKSNTIISSNEVPEYYTLVPVKKTNSYYLVIGYIFNSYLNFVCFKFLFSDNSIQFIFERKNEKHYSYDSYGNLLNKYFIQNKGLSCQLLKHNIYGNTLTCFFLRKDQNNFFTLDFFKVDNNAINIHSNFNPGYFSFGNIMNIKSIRSNDLTTAIVCMSLDIGKPICSMYDINKGHNTLSGFYNWNSYKCKHLYHLLKINYYEQTDEYIFSCLMEDKILSFFYIFSFDNKYYSSIDLKNYTDCDINAYSIIYSNLNDNYYLLSDLICQDIEYPFVPLMDNNIEEKEE